jgi:5-methylcytosine-specific restriction endonuclease McrA
VKKPQQNPRPAKNPGHVSAAVRRAVWSRDDGKCQWPLDSGGTCGSTLRLEIDHVVPRGRGGASTVDGCRLLCAFHNQLAARQVYGDDWMDRFTKGDKRDVPVAREPSSNWGPHPPGPPLRPILVSRRRRHSQQCIRRGAEDRASPSAACLGAIQSRSPFPEDQHCGEG